jgi:hypothetical protein
MSDPPSFFFTTARSVRQKGRDQYVAIKKGVVEGRLKMKAVIFHAGYLAWALIG